MTQRPQRDARPMGLHAWARLVMQPRAPAAHHRLLLDRLTRLADGRSDRLLVAMPPGSAKSTYCSIVMPPWWLARHPGAQIIATGHTEALTTMFGRRARGMVQEHGEALGLTLERDQRARLDWSVGGGGSYFATGVRGPIVGRRADLIVIDDPVKGHLEADSATARDTLWDWYRADLMPRLKPGGRVVLVMTRWHVDDLGGRLLAAGHDWDTLILPAIAGEDDPLGRAPGALLWPEWEGAEALARKRRDVGERHWQAEYQQQPQPDGGTLFSADRIALVDRPPDGPAVRAWDLAATEAADGRDPDWTVGLKLVRSAAGYCVTDVVRLRGSPLAVEQTVRATAAADGSGVRIGLPIDPGQAGSYQAEHLERLLPGYSVTKTRESGSKIARAGPVSAQVEAGALTAVNAPWTAALLNELREFPRGRKDDQVDALSHAFQLLSTAPAAARRANFVFMGR
jgi:predicted phage terminase large subunit-like protein